MPPGDSGLLAPELLPLVTSLLRPGIKRWHDPFLAGSLQPPAESPADNPRGRCQYYAGDFLVRVCTARALISDQPILLGRPGLWPTLAKLPGLLQGSVVHAIQHVEQLLHRAHLRRAAAPRAHRLLRAVFHRPILPAPTVAREVPSQAQARRLWPVVACRLAGSGSQSR